MVRFNTGFTVSDVVAAETVMTSNSNVNSNCEPLAVSETFSVPTESVIVGGEIFADRIQDSADGIIVGDQRRRVSGPVHTGSVNEVR